jgi:hypothetical protein
MLEEMEMGKRPLFPFFFSLQKMNVIRHEKKMSVKMLRYFLIKKEMYQYLKKKNEKVHFVHNSQKEKRGTYFFSDKRSLKKTRKEKPRKY